MSLVSATDVMAPCLSRRVQETGSRVEESAAFRLAILQLVLLEVNTAIWLDLRIFGVHLCSCSGSDT